MNENKTIEHTEEKIDNINQCDPLLSDLGKKEIEIEELNYRIETLENTIADINHIDPFLSGRQNTNVESEPIGLVFTVTTAIQFYEAMCELSEEEIKSDDTKQQIENKSIIEHVTSQLYGQLYMDHESEITKLNMNRTMERE